MALNAEPSEKSAHSGDVHASDRCSSLSEEIEGGLVLGVPPFGGRSGVSHFSFVGGRLQIGAGTFPHAQTWLRSLDGSVGLS